MITERTRAGTTKQRLLEAAEELFANEGFETVSVREITALAEANVAAVNYHFRSRAGLVNAVIERYIEPINRERLELLTALEKRGGETVEEILETFMRPFVTQVSGSELSERMFGKLMGRTFEGGVARVPPSVLKTFREVARRYRKALGKVLPELSDEDCFWRLQFMFGAMAHSLSHGDLLQEVTGGRCGSPGIDDILARCVRFAAAGFRGGAGVEMVEKKPQNEFDF